MLDLFCDCCDKEWRSTYDLNRHLNTKKLTGEARKKQKVRCDKKTYVCEICKKVYRSNYELTNHKLCKKKAMKAKVKMLILIRLIKIVILKIMILRQYSKSKLI
jgi:hypothetical protein